MHAWHLYEDGGLALSDESLENIKLALDGYGGELVSLGEALEGLARFSILLSDHQNDPTGAARVVGLMREYTPLFEPFWERVVEALATFRSAPSAPEAQLSEADPPGGSEHPEPHG